VLMKKLTVKSYSAAVALALLTISTQASSQTITLESLDKTISLTGELLSFENDTYRIRSAVGVIELGAAVVNCIGDDCPGANANAVVGAFNVAGSASINEELMPALVSTYADALEASVESTDSDNNIVTVNVTNKNGQGAQISVKSEGSQSALDELGRQDIDIAATTRAVRADEVTAFADRGLVDISGDGAENILALDGLMIVTAPDNAVRAITELNIARVFSGQITNWAELGGRNAPIQVYVRDAASGTGSVFFDLMMRPSGANFSVDAVKVETDRELAELVAADSNGIGFTSFSTVGDARALALRGVCGLQTPANAFTIKTEEYPLTRRLFAYADAQNETVQNFVEFVGSDAAQKVVADQGFVDLGVSIQPINHQGLRFAASVLPSDADVSFEQIQGMVQELITADRLSLTFRFVTASARLDTRAKADIQRLVEMMSGSQLENKEVILVGYTDSIGSGEANAVLSQLRSGQVLNELVAALPEDRARSSRVKSIGYGEMSPLGCNETENGRRINRRVEVWVRDIVDGNG